MDPNAVAYEAGKVEQPMFESIVHVLGRDMSCAFDTIRLCEICGTLGHTLEESNKLKDPVVIQRVYIQL